jgi:hypothetical protein
MTRLLKPSTLPPRLSDDVPMHVRVATIFFVAALACACSSSDSSPPESTEADASDLDASDESPDSADAPAEAVAHTKASFTAGETVTIASTGKHLAFPDLTRLKDGRILLVYREGASHVDASGRIMKQFGTADGSQWTTPEVLYDEPGIDDRDPSVATLSSGDVVVNYFQYKTSSLADGTMSIHHIFVGKSSDDAQTFGPFVQIDPGSMAPSNPKLSSTGRWVDDADQELIVQASSSAMIELGGEYVVASYGGPPLNLADLAHCPKSTITLYASIDLATWQERPLALDSATTWLQEPSVLRLASGKTLMHMRTATGSSPSNAGKMQQTISADDGKTWSERTSFPFIGHAPELAQMASGLVLTGYRELNASYTQEWVSLSWSLDDGATWSDPIRVEDCGAVECGYPAILELDADHFLFAWYASGGSAIKAVIYQYSLQ